jgi:hypothetical protein
MQEISLSRFANSIETDGALIIGVRGIARRLSFFVGRLSVLRFEAHTPFDKLKANGLLTLTGLLGRMNKSLFLSPTASLVSRHEVAIMYFGRTSEFLMMTSERMVLPTGRYTLGQLLRSLYKRGDRWVDELDDSHLMCTVNGRDARLFDTIKPGAEICISSRKSIFEA